MDDKNENIPDPKIHIFYAVEALNRTDVMRICHLQIYFPEQFRISNGWTAGPDVTGMMFEEDTKDILIENSEIKIPGKSARQFLWDTTFHTDDQKSPDFYQSLEALTDNFYFELTLVSDQNEKITITKRVNLRELVMNEYRSRFLDLTKKWDYKKPANPSIIVDFVQDKYKY